MVSANPHSKIDSPCVLVPPPSIISIIDRHPSQFSQKMVAMAIVLVAILAVLLVQTNLCTAWHQHSHPHQRAALTRASRRHVQSNKPKWQHTTSLCFQKSTTTTTTPFRIPVLCSTPSLEISENFHDDMRRVLESRRQNVDAQLLKTHATSSRKHKPVILETDVDGAQRAYAMLQHLREIGAANETSYQIVMRAFLQRGRWRWQSTTTTTTSSSTNSDDNSSSMRSSGGSTTIVCAADQLESLLQELLEIDVAVSMDTYNLVLEAYATCSTPRGDRDYARRADELLQRMQATTEKVPVESLMHVLHAYAWQQANLQDGLCAAAAERLLVEISAQTQDPAILLPCYDWTLEAWSKSGSVNSAQQADLMFAKIKALNETLTAACDESTLSLFDAETYSNAILAWSKCSQEGSAERANELLLEMLDRYQNGSFSSGSEPTLIAFNGVITAWGKTGRVDKAEQVLWLMEKIRPGCQGLVPDAVSYNSVLHAYMRSGDRKQALEKALSLVQYMEDNYHIQPAIKPNSFTYKTLMKCWMQSGRPNIAEFVEKILLQIERLWQEGDDAVEPNNRIFNMVINAYAKSDDFFAARKAFELLDRMKASSKCQPDIISYTSVLECLSKSADPIAAQQAEDLLDEAYQRYEKTGDPALMPNLRTFTMTILTLAKNHGSVVKARALLTRLVEQHAKTKNPLLKPNEYPFNYVLNCAANTLENQQQAFQIATLTYQEMRQSKTVNPDSFTYAFWLKCCNNLLPESDLRTKCVSYAFEECKKEGLVTNEVLTRLFQGNRPTVVNLLLENETNRAPYRSVKVQDLPPAWSRRNARRGKR
jgi:pentatricopeptide repeat protein